MHGILAFSGVIMSTTRPLSFLRQSVLSLPKGILWFDVRKKQKQKRSGRLFKWVLFLIVNRYCHFPCHMHLPVSFLCWLVHSSVRLKETFKCLTPNPKQFNAASRNMHVCACFKPRSLRKKKTIVNLNFQIQSSQLVASHWQSQAFHFEDYAFAMWKSMSRWFVCYLGHRNYITLAIFKSNLIAYLDLFVVLCSSSFDSKAKTTIIYLYVGSRWIQTSKHWEFYWASTHSSFVAWFLRVLPISLLTLHRDNTWPYFLNRLTFLRGSLVKLFPHKYVLWILESRAFIHK